MPAIRRAERLLLRVVALDRRATGEVALQFEWRRKVTEAVVIENAVADLVIGHPERAGARTGVQIDDRALVPTRSHAGERVTHEDTAEIRDAQSFGHLPQLRVRQGSPR